MGKRFFQGLTLVCALGVLASGAASAQGFEPVTVKVASTAMPWAKKANPNLPYGKGDGTPPAVAVGLKLVTGAKISMVATGSTTTIPGGGSFPPSGQADFIANNNLGGSGTPFPSMYINPAFYPVHLNELVGAFVDDKGRIIKSPFPVGEGITLTVPEGAKAVQFGLNDDIFADNSGEIVVVVSPVAP